MFSWNLTVVGKCLVGMSSGGAGSAEDTDHVHLTEYGGGWAVELVQGVVDALLELTAVAAWLGEHHARLAAEARVARGVVLF